MELKTELDVDQKVWLVDIDVITIQGLCPACKGKRRRGTSKIDKHWKQTASFMYKMRRLR